MKLTVFRFVHLNLQIMVFLALRRLQMETKTYQQQLQDHFMALFVNMSAAHFFLSQMF